MALLRGLGSLLRTLAGRGAGGSRAPSGARVLPAYAALARYHMRAAELEPRLRMLATQLAAERSRCRWCIEKGRHLWRDSHLPLDALRALPHYETSSLFSIRERAALRFADALTRYTESDGADGMPAEPLAAVRAHLSEPEVAALTAAVADMHFFNPITGQLGADVESRTLAPRRSAWGAPIGTAIRGFWL
ncbi:MAG TPA: hypothetical protein VGU74_11820 [Gemmatimonadales bacterium]|nr:hypothetical protein [Gemmatimonadales bacterium]